MAEHFPWLDAAAPQFGPATQEAFGRLCASMIRPRLRCAGRSAHAPRGERQDGYLVIYTPLMLSDTSPYLSGQQAETCASHQDE